MSVGVRWPFGPGRPGRAPRRPTMDPDQPRVLSRYMDWELNQPPPVFRSPRSPRKGPYGAFNDAGSSPRHPGLRNLSGVALSTAGRHNSGDLRRSKEEQSKNDKDDPISMAKQRQLTRVDETGARHNEVAEQQRLKVIKEQGNISSFEDEFRQRQRNGWKPSAEELHSRLSDLFEDSMTLQERFEQTKESQVTFLKQLEKKRKQALTNLRNGVMTDVGTRGTAISGASGSNNDLGRIYALPSPNKATASRTNSMSLGAPQNSRRQSSQRPRPGANMTMKAMLGARMRELDEDLSWLRPVESERVTPRKDPQSKIVNCKVVDYGIPHYQTHAHITMTPRRVKETKAMTCQLMESLGLSPRIVDRAEDFGRHNLLGDQVASKFLFEPDPDLIVRTRLGRRTLSLKTAKPAVKGVSPGTGSWQGGASITVEGHNFARDSIVYIGSALCTDVLVLSSTEIYCRTPQCAKGPGCFSLQVRVCNLDRGQEIPSQNKVRFKYTGPHIFTVSPASGSVLGGVWISLEGQGLGHDVECINIWVGGNHVKRKEVIRPDHEVRFQLPISEDFLHGDMKIEYSYSDLMLGHHPTFTYLLEAGMGRRNYKKYIIEDANTDIKDLLPMASMKQVQSVTTAIFEKYTDIIHDMYLYLVLEEEDMADHPPGKLSKETVVSFLDRMAMFTSTFHPDDVRIQLEKVIAYDTHLNFVKFCEVLVRCCQVKWVLTPDELVQGCLKFFKSHLVKMPGLGDQEKFNWDICNPRTQRVFLKHRHMLLQMFHTYSTHATDKELQDMNDMLGLEFEVLEFDEGGDEHAPLAYQVASEDWSDSDKETPPPEQAGGAQDDLKRGQSLFWMTKSDEELEEEERARGYCLPWVGEVKKHGALAFLEDYGVFSSFNVTREQARLAFNLCNFGDYPTPSINPTVADNPQHRSSSMFGKLNYPDFEELLLRLALIDVGMDPREQYLEGRWCEPGREQQASKTTAERLEAAEAQASEKLAISASRTMRKKSSSNSMVVAYKECTRTVMDPLHMENCGHCVDKLLDAFIGKLLAPRPGRLGRQISRYSDIGAIDEDGEAEFASWD